MAINEPVERRNARESAEEAGDDSIIATDSTSPQPQTRTDQRQHPRDKENIEVRPISLLCNLSPA